MPLENKSWRNRRVHHPPLTVSDISPERRYNGYNIHYISQLGLKDAAWFLPETLVTALCIAPMLRLLTLLQCWTDAMVRVKRKTLWNLFCKIISGSQSHLLLCLFCVFINLLIVISLEESIIIYYFPGVFSNILLTLLSAKSAEDICMTLFLLYNLIFLLFFLFTGNDLFKWLITSTSDGSSIPTLCRSIKKVFQWQAISCWFSVVYNGP